MKEYKEKDQYSKIRSSNLADIVRRSKEEEDLRAINRGFFILTAFVIICLLSAIARDLKNWVYVVPSFLFIAFVYHNKSK